jgi:hypothetical protein
MGTNSLPRRTAPGFLERHRVVAALSALLLVIVIGAVVGAAAGAVLAKIVEVVTHAFSGGM